jgi:hypothetical protein
MKRPGIGAASGTPGDAKLKRDAGREIGGKKMQTTTLKCSVLSNLDQNMKDRCLIVADICTDMAGHQTCAARVMENAQARQGSMEHPCTAAITCAKRPNH